MGEADEAARVRYLVDDVEAAATFYTTHLGFSPGVYRPPVVAEVIRGNLHLLLSGPESSTGRPLPDGRRPVAGGWNRINLAVDDLDREVRRLRAAGVRFRSDAIEAPGGAHVLLEDPSGNPVELFQAAR
jgi:catechol 2,3-dioxygenase-like lactoylglutathione lyase family enzyme